MELGLKIPGRPAQAALLNFIPGSHPLILPPKPHPPSSLLQPKRMGDFIVTHSRGCQEFTAPCSLQGTNPRVSRQGRSSTPQEAGLFTSSRPHTFQAQVTDASNHPMLPFLCMPYFLQKRFPREQDAKLPYVTETELLKDLLCPLRQALAHSRALPRDADCFFGFCLSLR